MDFNVTREQWIDRFVLRLAKLQAGAEPAGFLAAANRLWPSRGQVAPEAAADSEFASAVAGAHETDASPRIGGSQRFEKTERLPAERTQESADYVRDTDEWIARCLGRVLQLDPIIKAEEARTSVGGLAELERWRLMKPEAAAEQLYTPIKSRPA